MSTGISQCHKCGAIYDDDEACICSDPKDKTEARVWLDYTRFYYDENGDKWINEEDAHRSVAQLATRVQKLEEALVHALWYVDSYTSQSTKVRAEVDQILKGEE